MAISDLVNAGGRDSFITPWVCPISRLKPSRSCLHSKIVQPTKRALQNGRTWFTPPKEICYIRGDCRGRACIGYTRHGCFGWPFRCSGGMCLLRACRCLLRESYQRVSKTHVAMDPKCATIHLFPVSRLFHWHYFPGRRNGGQVRLFCWL